MNTDAGKDIRTAPSNEGRASGRRCNCRVCQHSRKFFAIVKAMSKKQDRAFMEDTYSRMAHAEDERSYWRLIVEGKWPTSAEILEAHGWVRAKAKKRRTDRTETR
jgi:hypothetical protein